MEKDKETMIGMDFALPGIDKTAAVIIKNKTIAGWAQIDPAPAELDIINGLVDDYDRMLDAFGVAIPEGAVKPLVNLEVQPVSNHTFDAWQYVTHSLLRNSLEGSIQRCLAGRHAFLDRHYYERMYMNTPPPKERPPVTEDAEFEIIQPKQLTNDTGN